MFHSLTGCDTVSFLCGKGKITAFSLWDVYPEITGVFNGVMVDPLNINESDFNYLEIYFVRLHDRIIEVLFVNTLRKK